MQWSAFFTIVAQLIIALFVGFVATAVIAAVVRGVKRGGPGES